MSNYKISTLLEDHITNNTVKADNKLVTTMLSDKLLDEIDKWMQDIVFYCRNSNKSDYCINIIIDDCQYHNVWAKSYNWETRTVEFSYDTYLKYKDKYEH